MANTNTPATTNTDIETALNSLFAAYQSGAPVFGRIHAILSPILTCLLYTSPSPRDLSTSRMPSSA